MNSNKKIQPPFPFVLIILDGWGYSDDHRCNAIYSASTPTWDHLWENYPHSLLQGSGGYVGLPVDQMGNSEVGHLNLGAGRVVYQEYTRIDRAINNGEFSDNEVLNAALDQAANNGGAVHVLGLLSPGGVHSHENHIHALLTMASRKQVRDVYLHAFLDGRDTPPKSAESSIEKVEKLFSRLGCGRFASICGRYYAMDRDQRWERVKLAYDVIAHGQAPFTADSAFDGLQRAYLRGETDEFIKPTAIITAGQQSTSLQDGDVLIFMNFRADRARQLTRTFIQDDFQGFDRGKRVRYGQFVSLTEYQQDFDIPVAFPPTHLKNVLGEYLSHQGYRQLRLAETEKYAHVTFFFNGGEEQEFPGEERILVSSPKVATYDLQPEMSAHEVTNRLVEAIENKTYEFIVCNYANPDMVGHTGNMSAAIKAIETIDSCLSRIYQAIKSGGGEMIITADHGNAEQMCDQASGQFHTAHTTNPVPMIYVGRKAKIKDKGALSDIAPSLLSLMGLDVPAEMDGKRIVELA